MVALRQARMRAIDEAIRQRSQALSQQMDQLPEDAPPASSCFTFFGPATYTGVHAGPCDSPRMNRRFLSDERVPTCCSWQAAISEPLLCMPTGAGLHMLLALKCCQLPGPSATCGQPWR